jgi:phosphoglucosamine mutase
LSIAVQENDADLGIALDGDADRLLMVDATGRVYSGDELLYIMVKDRMAIGPVQGAVGTLMTNMAVEVAFREMGIGFVRAKVGDRYVLEVLQERGWLLGGEGSGHLLFLDKHTTGDGIISALQVLSALKRCSKTLARCTEGIALYPQTLINVKVAPGYDWQKSSAVLAEKEMVEAELGQNGRVLIRASGTEPLIRVMVEAKSADIADMMAQRIAGKVKA